MTEHNTIDELVIDSSGNVFDDLGIPTTEDEMLKVALARVITSTVRKRDLTQIEAAKIIGVDQAKVSLLLRGRLKGFSTDRLVRYLCALGKDIDIRISGRYRNNEPGRIKVAVGY
jgi:predicted XRE-type DNA-binding protein